MQRIIAHLDMNSYFASVEQQANPLLRDKPVGVCAYLSNNGCIIASSIEAKARGVKTGARIRDAKMICPEIILVQNEPAKYRSTTERIFNLLAEYSDAVEPYSIDEAFIDLSSWAKSIEDATQRMTVIQQRIKQEVGVWLRCSMGISYTRWLAKFASDITTPDSILTITQDNLTEQLANAKLTDAWGINVRLQARLSALGIHTLNELRTHSVTNLRRALGMTGFYLWANVNGLEYERVHKTQRAPKSIGHSYCLPRHTTDRTWLRTILYKLCERTGRRLRNHGFEAQTISAYAGLVTGGGIHQVRKTTEPLFTSASIFNAADRILFSAPLLDAPRILAVSVSRLHPVSNQTSWLHDTIKQQKLSYALDHINDTFGEFSIILGGMWGTADNAHDRVGFRKTVPLTYQPDELRYE